MKNKSQQSQISPVTDVKPLRVLAIETATYCGGVAILDSQKLLASLHLNTTKTHSERLMASIHTLLNELSFTVADLDGIVISRGPGSFTGIRIGMSVAKGLAFAAKKPLVAVSTLPQLERIGVPIILLNKKSYAFSVGTDNIDGARQAVDHLCGLGHRRIAYIGGSRSEEEDTERRAGYEYALTGYGISRDPSLVAEGDGWHEGGQRCTEQLLALQHPPSAVFCFNDLTASGALQAAYRAGVRVPQDLSVVGFDDSSLASLLVPSLTTVAQQCDQMTRLALQMALDLMDGNPSPARFTLPGKLVVRQSTAPPPNS